MHAQLPQRHPTLCDPMDCSPPGSSVHEILQARILEWVAISFSRGVPDPGIEPGSPELTGGFSTTEPPGKSIKYFYLLLKISVSWRPPWHLPGLNHPPGVELRTWSLPDRWRVRSPRLHRNSGREWKVKAKFCPEGLGHLRFFAQILFHWHKPLAGH